MGIMFKSKIVRETLKAKGYDLNQVKTGRTEINEDLRRFLEKLADDKPVVQGKGEEEPEVTILKRNEADGSEDSKERIPDGKKVMQSLVERIPEGILQRIMVRKKKVAFKEEPEHLGLSQESGSGKIQRKMLKKKRCPGSVKNMMKTQRKAAMIKIVYA